MYPDSSAFMPSDYSAQVHASLGYGMTTLGNREDRRNFLGGQLSNSTVNDVHSSSHMSPMPGSSETVWPMDQSHSTASDGPKASTNTIVPPEAQKAPEKKGSGRYVSQPIHLRIQPSTKRCCLHPSYCTQYLLRDEGHMAMDNTAFLGTVRCYLLHIHLSWLFRSQNSCLIHPCRWLCPSVAQSSLAILCLLRSMLLTPRLFEPEQYLQL